MIERDDRVYFALRAAEEQEAAENASDPVVAEIHRTLAASYAELARLVPLAAPEHEQDNQ